MLEMASKRTVFFKVFKGNMPFHLFMSFYENNGHDFLSKEVLSYTSLVSLDINTHDTCRLLYHNNIFHSTGSTHK